MFVARRAIQLRPIIASLQHANHIAVVSNTKICSGLNTQLAGDVHFHFVRHYAKNTRKAEKAEQSRSKGHHAVQLSGEELNEVINIDAYNESLQKLVDKMQDDFIQNLSLRSTTGAIETLKVKVDGEMHELQELAQISRKNPKTIILNMIGFPQTIPAVLKALQTSGMNLNPQQEGTTLFIPVPKVTKEYRENLAKNAKALYIKYRDALKGKYHDIVWKDIQFSIKL